MTKGFKVFDPDWTCSPCGHTKQYTCPGKFEEDVTPIRCGKGMHFCKVAADCFNYYNFDPHNKVAEVIAYGDIAEEDDKCCTNKLEIVREIPWSELLTIVNSGAGNTGLCNTGNCNTGDCNTGSCNTGDCNTWNCNTGNCNTGNFNTGNCNTGNCNTGDCNTGNRNTGDCNTGNRNTGYCNQSDFCTGDFNLSDHETGCFCVEEHKIRFFDKESSMTFEQWRNSKAYRLICRIRFVPTEWVESDDMTGEEKADHPEFETTGGYLKTNDLTAVFLEWWAALTENEKKTVCAIPNFDPDKFKLLTGITV